MAATALAEVQAETRTVEQHKRVDLLTADYLHDGKGSLLIVLPDKTPFDSDAEARKRYRNAFAAGFQSGFKGVLSQHVPSAEPCPYGELEGWCAGQWAGYRAHEKEESRRPDR